MKTALRLAVGLLVAAATSPSQARTLEKTEVDGNLTIQQMNTLANETGLCTTTDKHHEIALKHKRDKNAKLTERDRKNAISFVLKCLVKEYKLSGRQFPNKRESLQRIYNTLVEKEQSSTPALSEVKSTIDGHHRIKVYTTTQPGASFCNKEEWLQVSFVPDKMDARPITRKEMERFIAGAYLATIGSAECVNQKPKKVTYVFTLADQVLAEREFKPEYSYFMNKRFVYKQAAQAFGRKIGGEVLDAAYTAR